MLVQMLPAALELLADKPNTVEPHPHGKFLIFFLYFAVTGAFLRQCLMVQRQRQYDVGSDLASMERTVEPPQFYCVVAVEETV